MGDIMAKPIIFDRGEVDFNRYNRGIDSQSNIEDIVGFKLVNNSQLKPQESLQKLGNVITLSDNEIILTTIRYSETTMVYIFIGNITSSAVRLETYNYTTLISSSIDISIYAYVSKLQVTKLSNSLRYTHNTILGAGFFMISGFDKLIYLDADGVVKEFTINTNAGEITINNPIDVGLSQGRIVIVSDSTITAAPLGDKFLIMSSVRGLDDFTYNVSGTESSISTDAIETQLELEYREKYLTFLPHENDIFVITTTGSRVVRAEKTKGELFTTANIMHFKTADFLGNAVRPIVFGGLLVYADEFKLYYTQLASLSFFEKVAGDIEIPIAKAFDSKILDFQIVDDYKHVYVLLKSGEIKSLGKPVGLGDPKLTGAEAFFLPVTTPFSRDLKIIDMTPKSGGIYIMNIDTNQYQVQIQSTFNIPNHMYNIEKFNVSGILTISDSSTNYYMFSTTNNNAALINHFYFEANNIVYKLKRVKEGANIFVAESNIDSLVGNIENVIIDVDDLTSWIDITTRNKAWYCWYSLQLTDLSYITIVATSETPKMIIDRNDILRIANSIQGLLMPTYLNMITGINPTSMFENYSNILTFASKGSIECMNSYTTSEFKGEEHTLYDLYRNPITVSSDSPFVRVDFAPKFNYNAKYNDVRINYLHSEIESF